MFQLYFLIYLDIQQQICSRHPRPADSCWSEALWMHNLWQMFCQLIVPVTAQSDSPWRQAIPLPAVRSPIHAAVSPSTAHQNPHRREAIPLLSCWLHKSLLTALESAEPHTQPHDRQAVPLQLVLQVFQWRAKSTGAHPKAHRNKTSKDEDLHHLWKVLCARDLPCTTYGEAWDNW